ncbi:adenosylcobinamide-phosphate synthase CbiB [Anoxybacteroides amylolyticum]|uniref:adenosylcobinamide-phosphate synthase CbiB n=1 Tax=Anoxybacteroides amylolyticum TaxID=294699 RepID=UPI00082FF0E8|nr:adenosylcobinamide-phosphate synthase CbiB [Anoxybacillus amylolyticus]
MYHLYAMVGAVFLDTFIGDPRSLPHPVRAMGALIAALDRHLNKGRARRWKGILAVMVVIGTVFSFSYALISLSYQLSPVVGVIVEAVCIFTTIAAKSLQEAAWNVLDPLENGDIQKARQELGMIVGRDTETLNEPEMVRACVETVAENTSDGVTAPLFYALIGGAPLALLYRAVNTCDSMLGYKNEMYREFGWASARLDDVLNYVPARLTAWVMLLANSRSLRRHARLLLRDARKHPSPNSGWGEAAMAAILGVQLGGTNTYRGVISERPKIGDAVHTLTKEHIRQAVSVMWRTLFVFVVLLLIGGMIVELAIAWSKSTPFL